jgi:hypothetical protein
MADAKTYAGGCHCGNVRYEVTADLGSVVECNCSICSKSGALLTFVGEPQFKLLKSEGELGDYQFNTHNIHHLFCRTCGIKSFARGTAPGGKKMVAINVRCLDGVDLGSLQRTPFDGKKL